MSSKKTEAIILRSDFWEENYKVVTCLSEKYGRLSFYALGLSKQTSKNKYSLQTFSISELELFLSNKPDSLSKLKTGRLLFDSSKLSKNFNNYIYVSIISKICMEIFPNKLKNVKAYSMLKKSLINICDEKNSFRVYVVTLFFLLNYSGGKWYLKKCTRCNKPQKNYVRFDYREHGLICIFCILPDENRQPKTFIDLIIFLDNSFWENAFEINFNLTDIITLHIVLKNYYLDNIGLFVKGFKMLENTPSLTIPINKRLEYM